MSVSGDRASLGAPADCDYSIFDTFRYQQFDLQTTDGKSISGTVVGQYPSNPPGCTISAHFSGARKTR